MSLLGLAFVAATLAPVIARAEKPAVPTPAAIVRLEGRIDDYNYEQFIKRFDRAKAAGAKVVIVDIDTYGGLVSAGLDISKFLKSQNEVRTIAFVSSKAISAGAMIALACDEIVMNPVAQLGDCAPIVPREGGGIETLGQAERAKAESPILADFAGSARPYRRPYNVRFSNADSSSYTAMPCPMKPSARRVSASRGSVPLILM